MTETPVAGPVDYVLIEFHGDRLTGQVAAAVLDLVDRGIVAIYDVVVVGKEEDGTVYSVDLAEAAAAAVGDLAGAHSGLVAEEDMEEAARAMEPGTLAVLIVYENVWARPFVAASREAGGELVASGRIPAPDVMAALEAMDAREPAGATS